MTIGVPLAMDVLVDTASDITRPDHSARAIRRRQYQTATVLPKRRSIATPLF